MRGHYLIFYLKVVWRLYPLNGRKPVALIQALKINARSACVVIGFKWVQNADLELRVRDRYL